MINDQLFTIDYVHQYGQYFSRFLDFAVIFLYEKIGRQSMRKSENIGHIVLGTVQ